MPSTQSKPQGKLWNQQELEWSGSHYQGLPILADASDVHELAMDMLQDHLRPDARILDVAAGAGAFSRRLLDHGFGQVEALELREEAFAVPGVPVHPLDLNGAWSEQLPVRFDALVGLEVIEHLENPWHFTRQCSAALSPGGLLLLSTPNIESSRSRIEFLLTAEFRFFRAKDYVDCGHITPMTARQVERTAVQAGLQQIECRHSRHKGIERPGRFRKTLRTLLYALSWPFMKGQKRGEESLFLFQKSK
jgi:2-polyprenyl-3-methyl-5-hydroxy-6-metoxy-1,4-benzoquinol methylase